MKRLAPPVIASLLVASVFVNSTHASDIFVVTHSSWAITIVPTDTVSGYMSQLWTVTAEAVTKRGHSSVADTTIEEVAPALDMSLYGFIKADASYDNSRTNPGNFVLYVDREVARRNDDEFNLTANQTRLGLQIEEESVGVIRASGRLEIDFYGNYADENKAKIQMRHAFFEVAWPNQNVALLAGQTWDVVSPLNPSTVNYSVLWNAGNIGYRRPQIRVSKTIQLSNRSAILVQGAIARTVGHDVLGAGAPSETGEDNGFPTFQGRFAASLPLFGNSTTELGFSGHYATEECDTSATGSSVNFNSWSLNFDLVQPVTTWMTLKAEAFTGANLKAYLGGIGQGLRTVTSDNSTSGFDKEIASTGGWLAVSLSPAEKWLLGFGASVDDVKDADIHVGDRTLNRVFFGNVSYALTRHASIAAELSHWRTDYRDSGKADDLRLQTALTYKF